jgi:hypothetical protein
MAEAAPPNIPIVAVVPMFGADAIAHLLTICGFSDTQRNSVMNVEGITSIAALHNIYIGDVKQMTENLSRLAAYPRCQCAGIHS